MSDDEDSHAEEESSLLGLPKSRVHKRWVSEEDEAIIQHVQLHGEENWAVVAAMLPDRTPLQCSYRWKESLNPKIRKGLWTAEEDAMLLSLVNELGTGRKEWWEIADRLGTRTRLQCKNRWKAQLNPSIKKGQWMPEEDNLILTQRNNHSTSYKEITKMLENRCEADVRSRYLQLMRPKTATPQAPRPWTSEEDELLRQLVKEYSEGNWETVASHFPGRSHFQVHRRWHDFLARPQAVRTGPWSAEEDAQLLQLVQQFGCKWTVVAQHMVGRLANHCRQRYSYRLDPALNRGDWTAEEDALILEKRLRGQMTWAQISVLLPGRCCAQVKQRFASLMKSDGQGAKSRSGGQSRKRRQADDADEVDDALENENSVDIGVEGLLAAAADSGSSDDEAWHLRKVSRTASDNV